MEKIIDALMWLLYDTSQGYLKIASPDPRFRDTAMFLQQFSALRLSGLKTRAQCLAKDRYTLSFVGLTNVGKSTLAEVLLGAKIAPQLNGPGTSFPIEYSYGDAWELLVHGVNSFRGRYAAANDLGAELSTRCLGLSDQEASQITKAVVNGPMPLLKNNLILADTPGFGAADIKATDDDCIARKRLQCYINASVDEIYFCVSGENAQVGSEEKTFFDAIRNKCRIVLITKWGDDDESGDDEKKYRQHYESSFYPCRMLFVGSRSGYGIDNLRSIILRNTNIANRQAEFKQQIREVWEDIRRESNGRWQTKIKWTKWRLDNFMALCEQNGIAMEF